MRIIQLTDLHIDRTGEDTRGVDVRSNFCRLLEKLPKWRADEIVITGDLCLTGGSRQVYDWIIRQLASVNLPVNVISGNHDDPVLLAEAFQVKKNLKKKELYYLRTETPVPIFYLDTTKRKVSKPQLVWLEEELRKCLGPIVIFMHHPPLLAGVPYMDQKHALKNRDDLLSLLLSYPDPIHVYCGHYHVEKLVAFHNVLAHITPSAYFQIDQFEEEFAVDHHNIGLRVIDIRPDQISSTVVYLEGKRLDMKE